VAPVERPGLGHNLGPTAKQESTLTSRARLRLSREVKQNCKVASDSAYLDVKQRARGLPRKPDSEKHKDAKSQRARVTCNSREVESLRPANRMVNMMRTWSPCSDDVLSAGHLQYSFPELSDETISDQLTAEDKSEGMLETIETATGFHVPHEKQSPEELTMCEAAYELAETNIAISSVRRIL